MRANKAAVKRALSLGTVWQVKNALNPLWNPGAREVVKVQSNAVGFKSTGGTSWLYFDQTGDKFFINEDGTYIEVRDEDGNAALSYTKVQS